jgi:hypothetical protein
MYVKSIFAFTLLYVATTVLNCLAPISFHWFLKKELLVKHGPHFSSAIIVFPILWACGHIGE